MKKLFITLLLCCFCAGQGAHGAMIIQQFSGGDTCVASGLVYSHYAENNDDATQNGGCSYSATYKSWDRTQNTTTAAYTSTAGQFSDGSYGVAIVANSSVIVTETDWLDLTSKGTYEAWIKSTETVDNKIYFEVKDITNGAYVNLVWRTGEKLRVAFNDGGGFQSCTTVAVLDTTDGSDIKVSWDFSQSAGNDVVEIDIDGTVRTCSGLTVGPLTDAGGAANDFEYSIMGVTNGQANSATGYYDNVKFYNTYTDL